MLKNFEKSKPEDKEVLNEEIKAFRSRLIGQQQLIREKKLPVLVLMEGWAAAGKGSLIKEIISEIDPRFYNVVSPAVIPESESRYPFLIRMPPRSRRTASSSSWTPGGWNPSYAKNCGWRSPGRSISAASALSASSNAS